MKKLQLIFFTGLAGFILLLLMSVSRVADAPVRQEAKSSANQQQYAKMLNGDDAFYQDYNDFLKGGQKWKYLTENTILTFGKMNIFNIVFKTDQGKRQKLTPAEFWGWRQDGKVWRNGDFVNGKVTKMPFRVTQVTGDYIMYQPYHPQNVSIEPFEWFSDDFISPIMHGDVYFKRHSKETYNRIEVFKKNCYDTQTYAGKQEQIWTNVSDELLRASPDIVLIFTYDHAGKFPGGKGSYKK